MRAPILALKEVRLADGPTMLFDGVDLAIDARTRACLVGRNGAGKSTLLRILSGQIEADAGERTVTPGTRIAYVPQEPEITGDPESVHRAGISVRGQTISETVLKEPEDALDFAAWDLIIERGDD